LSQKDLWDQPKTGRTPGEDAWHEDLAQIISARLTGLTGETDPHIVIPLAAWISNLSF